MTPVGGSVWSQTPADRSSDRPKEVQTTEVETKPTSSLVKPAPWAKSSQSESEAAAPSSTSAPEISSTREAIKNTSWTVDSDDDEDDGKITAPLPAYANPAVLASIGASSAPSAAPSMPPKTAPPAQQYPYAGGGGGHSAPRFGDRNPSSALGGPVPNATPRDGYNTRSWGGPAQHPPHDDRFASDGYQQQGGGVTRGLRSQGPPDSQVRSTPLLAPPTHSFIHSLRSGH